MLRRTAVVAALALALARAAALFDDDPELSVAARHAGPSDIRAVWLLAEATDESDLCPRNITHTTWTRRSDGTLAVPHNTIIEDGARCESAATERSLLFYPARDYAPDFVPVPGAPALPGDFVAVMASSGFNVNARFALDQFGERYLMGYEPVTRVCDDNVSFRRQSTAFIAAPFDGPVNIKNLATTLTNDRKWLIMVPLFSRVYCLYSSDINGPDDDFRQLPSRAPPEPVPSDELLAPTPAGPDGPLPSPSPGLGPGAPPASPEPDETPQESPDDDPVCFPAAATVTLADGRRKPIHQVAVGDLVQVAPRAFSPVFAFTHADPAVRARFVTLTTASRHISATPGHFIYVNGRPAPVETAKVGDALTLADGSSATVTKVSLSVKTGLYNPQTLHGDIVVDGVLATTYTKAIDPAIAHAALAPLRAAFNACGVDALSAIVGAGARSALRWLPVASA